MRSHFFTKVYLFRNDIFLGAHDKKNDGEVYDVSKVEMHEDYNSWTGMKHDVAVVKLSRPAKLGKKISTICLPSQGSRVKIGTECYVTGKYWMTYGRLVIRKLKQRRRGRQRERQKSSRFD